MKKEMICFGVRDYEVPFFNELGAKYGYNLKLEAPFLTNDNFELALNNEIVMVRGNCFLNADSITKLHSSGLKYLLTRTVGYNHIDIEACKKLGIEVAYVPGYSPNAIAELGLSLAMMLLRNTAYTVNLTRQNDFRVTSQMFSREIRNCTVGVIGCGKIGLTSATLYKGLGAKVIANDIYQSEEAKKVVTFVGLEELIKTSDIITLHMPHIKGVNDHLINSELIAQMKDNAILINTARGELVDLDAVVTALENNKLYGAGIDVIENEKEVFFQKFDGKIGNDLFDRASALFPKLLFTPHVGASTDEALTNMIEISLQNMEEYINTNTCKNSLTK
ncbi:MAG: NAD(P)-dependent oxidoreductase [bacterium]